MSRSPGFTHAYLERLGRACGRDFLAELPLPGLYASLTNVIAGDYRRGIQALGAESCRLDLDQLLERAREDLERVEWVSEAECREQWDTWRRCGGRRAVGRTLAARFGAGARRWKTWARSRCRGPVLGRVWSALAALRRRIAPTPATPAAPPPIPCADLLGAARAAETHYSPRIAGPVRTPTVR
jgi:hypothetical protein